MPGYGSAALVGAAWNKPGDKAGGARASLVGVLPGEKSRAYFAGTCDQAKDFDPSEYMVLKLLGQTLRYTVDLSGAGCGCNMALYLTELATSTDRSSCEDYYCDANAVCGNKCVEIDIQEANTRAWYSTVHSAEDPVGFGQGYGSDRSTWNATVYGPGGKCIDTLFPFQVAAAFPRRNATGPLEAFEVTLSQIGKPCPLSARIDAYEPFGRAGGLASLSEALERGMTPVISYWGPGEDLAWLDGPGGLGEGPCAAAVPKPRCVEDVVFSAFSVTPIR